MGFEDIGMTDCLNIIRQIKELYGLDLEEYALTSLRRRIERSIELHNLRRPELLLARLREDQSFFDTFLSDIAVESTEFFRDPGMWIILRNRIIPGLCKSDSVLRILLPSCVSGDELYSLLILLKESNCLERVEITANCPSERNKQLIQGGIVNVTKLESSLTNYNHFEGTGKLHDYFIKKENHWEKNPALMKKVKVLVSGPLQESIPYGQNIILFRNQMIYFSQKLQDEVISALYKTLIPHGFLIIGHRERFEEKRTEKLFRKVDPGESIYQKN